MHLLPKRLRSNMGQKTCFLHLAPSNLVTRLHMRKNALIIVTWSEHFKIRCHVIFTQLRETVKQCACIVASQVSQRESADEGVDMSEPQAHLCITPEQWSWRFCSVSAIPINKSVIARIKTIRIEILTSDFPTFFGS